MCVQNAVYSFLDVMHIVTSL